MAHCLNPCFSGTYSRSTVVITIMSNRTSLNPCFSGTYSRSTFLLFKVTQGGVLILVLVEHTLGGFNKLPKKKHDGVLILVLVEHTLGGATRLPVNKPFFVLILVLVEHTLGGFHANSRLPRGGCLNPCFSGTYSRSDTFCKEGRGERS